MARYQRIKPASKKMRTFIASVCLTLVALGVTGQHVYQTCNVGFADQAQMARCVAWEFMHNEDASK